MTDHGSEIDAALSSQAKVPRYKVLLWMESAKDLQTLAKLYKLTGEGYYRIEPELGKEAECKAIERYLLECIRQNTTGDEEVESRYEAAATLHGWLRQLLESGDCNDIIKGIARAITEMYLENDENICDAIETGFLEHALESAGLRPFFEALVNGLAFKRCMGACAGMGQGTSRRLLEWGKAHPDASWNQIEELRRLIEKEREPD